MSDSPTDSRSTLRERVYRMEEERMESRVRQEPAKETKVVTLFVTVDVDQTAIETAHAVEVLLHLPTTATPQREKV